MLAIRGVTYSVATSNGFPARQAGQVLHLLALNRGLPIGKDRLAQLLWHDDPPASWLSTLEGYVSLLRRALHVGLTTAPSAVVTNSGGYLLDAGRVRVDVDRFDALVTQADRARP